MKKPLLILLCLFTLNTLTYASFPITESNAETLTSEDTEEDETSLPVYILRGILFFYY